MEDINDGWNISNDRGEQYIIEVFDEILSREGDTEIRGDILSSKMNKLAKSKKIKLFYNNKQRNLNYYMKHHFINLTNFLSIHEGKYTVEKRKGILFVKKNENWLDNEEWLIVKN